MSADRRTWHLKVDRAEQHLEEVKAFMAAYAAKHPYEAVRAVKIYRLRELAFC